MSEKMGASVSGLRAAGFVTVAVVGVSAAFVSAATTPASVGCYAAFGLLYAFASAKRDDRLLARQFALCAASACAVTLCSFDALGLAPTLLVVLAGTAPFVLSRWGSAVLLVAQTLGLAALRWAPTLRGQMHWLIYLGFELFALTAAQLAKREAVAAAALRQSHADLVGVSALLAEDSRMAERQRIARDLHDQLGHALTALHLQLEAAQHGGATNTPAALDSAQALVKQAIGKLRQVVSAMRQDSFDLREAVAALAAGTPLAIDVRWPSVSPQLSVDLEHALFFCIQEALTNVMKHARAKRVTLTFDRSELAIEDDGQGVDPATFTPHHGLLGMGERMQVLGGTVTFAQTPSFRIDIAWPPP